MKCFQRLGYFPAIKDIPTSIVKYICSELKLPDTMNIKFNDSKAVYRYHHMLRTYLNVASYDDNAKKLALEVAFASAAIHNYPADIINSILEELMRLRYELPAFSHLDRMVKHVRYTVNNHLFSSLNALLPDKLKKRFDDMLAKSSRTDYNKLKQLPKSPTITHFRELIVHHQWLMDFGDMSHYIAEISKIKYKQFVGEAKSLDASNMRDLSIEKRNALITCLVHAMQVNVKDSLILTFTKTIAKIEKQAKIKLDDFLEKNLDKTKKLIALLGNITSTFSGEVDIKTLQKIKEQFTINGGADNVVTDCEKVLASHENNHLPFMWSVLRHARPTLIQLIHILDMKSTIENDKTSIIRRQFEACIFSYLADALNTTDLWVAGSSLCVDFRQELLPWDECLTLLPAHCQNVGIAETGDAAVQKLRKQLADKAYEIDRRYPDLA